MACTPVEAPAVYAIADVEALGGAARVPEAVATIAASGIRWIQLRAKRLAGDDLHRLVGACLERLAGRDAVLWIDDRADLARIHRLPGVHVGERDLPPGAVRRVVGDETWIGLSTHGPDAVAAADADPDVDVVAIGPVFATTGKADPAPVVGLDGVREARRRTAKPLVAIGGIDAESLPAVLGAGADAVAVLGAVCRGDVGRNCERLLRAAGTSR